MNRTENGEWGVANQSETAIRGFRENRADRENRANQGDISKEL